VAFRTIHSALNGSLLSAYLGQCAGSFSRGIVLPSPARGRGTLIVVANAKKSMGCTKEGTNR
jgi:hypothetical protein